MKMKDFLGEELEIGDTVVYMSGSRSAYLTKGVVTGFTNAFVVIKPDSWGDGKKSPDKCVKIKE